MRVACATMSGPGHAFPMLALCRAITARGHEATLICGAEHREAAASAGALWTDYPPGISGSPRDALRLYDDAASMALQMREQLHALAPDVVVHDAVALGPALAAESLGMPWATLVVHPLHVYSKDLPPFGLGRRLIPLLEANVRRNVLRDLARARDDMNRARAALGLPPTTRLDGQLSPHLVLVATLPSLERARSDWPHQAHVVGPMVWDEHAAVLPLLPAGEGPLALIAPSTAHDMTGFTAASVRAVASMGARGFLTGAAPAKLPGGIVHAPFAPHGALLEQADVVITTGGHGIVARALSAGVPLVIAPGPGDQRENASRVVTAGAGVWVRRTTARAIARSLGRVLRRATYRAAARRLAGEAAGLDGAGRGAELLEELVGRGSVDDRKTASL